MRLCSSAGFLPPTNTSNTLVKSTRLLPHLQMEQSTTGFTPKTEQEAVFTQASHIFLLYVFFSIVCFIIGNWLFKIISLTELVLWGSFGSKRTGLAPELKHNPEQNVLQVKSESCHLWYKYSITLVYSKGALAHGQSQNREMIDILSIIAFQKGSWY